MILGDFYQDGHQQNSVFAEEDAVHRYNPTSMQRALRNALLERGIEINTPDVNQGRSVDFALHVEGRALPTAPAHRFLLALENPHINTLNDSRDYIQQFDRVFTWNPKFYDLPNVTPVLIPNGLEWKSFAPFSERDAFSCLINANKHFPVKLETDLYQERLNVIRWYQRHAPDAFDLYGIGWNKPARGIGWQSNLNRRLQRLGTQVFGYRPFPSYRGEVKDKADVYARYRFAFCYENVVNLTNYVTEKMIDCLLVGCVPIYWGADNVTELVPAECFIDRRAFSDTADLHRYLLSVDTARYTQYQEAIAAFRNSEAAQLFSNRHYVTTVADGIAESLRAARRQPSA